ncbi:MAG TPA: urease accessory UreF family protein [Methylomirabilota bacterium]|nr:urease accessory UreF family protein [Methylomirabilota bacterium]
MVTSEAALYRLMAWLSPAYPTGAFSYSHGLEYAVETARVTTADTLIDWVTTVIEAGAGRVDAALFAAAWRAAEQGEDAALDEAVALAAAWRSSAETALESVAQGAAFLSVTATAWPRAALRQLALRHQGQVPLSTVVGAACAWHGIPLAPALAGYLQAFAANLISAGVRLIPLGQTDGQRAVAALEPAIARAAEAAFRADLGELGTSSPLLDWCSMKHETQYTRLFRS